MEQRYNVIRFEDGKKISIPNYEFDSNAGWQTFNFTNCVPYINSGVDNTSTLSYAYVGTDLDDNDWEEEDTYYLMGGLAGNVKDSLSDAHGGMTFIYFDSSNGNYCVKSMTRLDSKSFIYINGQNYLGNYFDNATTDYPTLKIFYNFTQTEDKFVDVTIKTNNYSSLGYDALVPENYLAQIYPASLDYEIDLNLQYSDYPTEIDPLRFFQDLDLYDRKKWGNYLGYIRVNKLADGAAYLDSTGIDYYGAPLFNLLEQRLYAMEYCAPIVIGEKPKLTLYDNSDPVIQGVHYIGDN